VTIVVFLPLHNQTIVVYPKKNHPAIDRAALIKGELSRFENGGYSSLFLSV
jgi:hypothetical protein